MDSVPDPVAGFGFGDQEFFKQIVEWDANGTIFLGKLPYDCGKAVDECFTGLIVRKISGAPFPCEEGCAQDQFDRRILLPYPLKQAAISLLPVVEIERVSLTFTESVSHVINPDQD